MKEFIIVGLIPTYFLFQLIRLALISDIRNKWFSEKSWKYWVISPSAMFFSNYTLDIPSKNKTYGY